MKPRFIRLPNKWVPKFKENTQEYDDASQSSPSDDETGSATDAPYILTRKVSERGRLWKAITYLSLSATQPRLGVI